jgi:predicted nucleotidyltransferase
MGESVGDFGWLEGEVDEHPYPMFVAVLSGAHRYGFASGDSDYDIRGAHVLPLEEIVGLGARRDTIDMTYHDQGREIDVVTYDLERYIRFLLDKKAMVLEHIFCPHVICAQDEFDELRTLAEGCITRHHAHHYLGFVRSRWNAFEKTRRLKALLYAYRGAYTGIHLMRTGRVESNLATLADEYDRPDILDLVEAKQAGTEKMELPASTVEDHRAPIVQLLERLEREHEASKLPDAPSAQVTDKLDDLLVRVRLKSY